MIFIIDDVSMLKKTEHLNEEILHWVDINYQNQKSKQKIEDLDEETRQTILLFNEFFEDLYNSRGANNKEFALALLNNEKFKKYLWITSGNRFGKDLGDHEIYLLDERYCIIPNSVTLRRIRSDGTYLDLLSTNNDLFEFHTILKSINQEIIEFIFYMIYGKKDSNII